MKNNINNIKTIADVPEKIRKRHLSPKGDEIFKRLFGSLGSEKILKGLLESILDIQIESVSLDAKQEFLSEKIDGKKNVLDVHANLKDGTQINIEMQTSFEANLGRRSLLYWCRLYSTQVEKGDDKLETLHKTIGIWILDEGTYFPDSTDYHSIFKLRKENGSTSELFDDLELHFFELHKLRKYGTISPRKLDFWMWFIDHSDEEMVKMAERSVEEIREAVKKLRELEADPIVSEIAFKEMLDEMTKNSREDYIKKKATEEGHAEGLAKGHAEGLAKGRAEGRAEIAKNMLKKDMNISELTGLSKEDIIKLKDEL